MQTVRFTALFLLLCMPMFSHGQKWERWEGKITTALEDGKYRKANRKARRLEKKTIKRLGYPNPYLPFVGKVRAAFALQEGIWADFEKNMAYIQTVSDSTFEATTKAYAYYQLQTSQLWAEAGYPRKAYQELQKAKAIFQKEGQPEEIKAEMLILEANLLVEMGQFSNALKWIREHQNFMYTYGGGSSNSKESQRKRMHQFSAFIIAGGKALMGKGEVSKVDSVLKTHEVLFKKKLRKNDWPKVDFTLLKAQVMESLSKPKVAEKLYEEAYDLALKKRIVHDKRVRPYHEALIEAYYRLGNNKKGKAAIKSYGIVAQKAFKRDSYHRLHATFMEGKISYHDGKYKDVAKKMAELKEHQGLLPSIHPLKIAIHGLRYKTSLKNKQFEKAYQSLQEISEGTAQVYGKRGVPYHKNEMARAAHLFHYTNELTKVGTIIQESHIGFLQDELAPQHKDFVVLQHQLAQYYKDIDQLELALKAMKTAGEAARLKPNNSNIYGQQLVQYANLLFHAGELKQSTQYLEAAAMILEPLRFDLENVQSYASIMFQKARMMRLKGDFEAAEDMLEDAEKYLRKRKSLQGGDQAISLELMADLSQSTGQFSEAEQHWKAAIDVIQKQYGAGSRKSLGVRLKLGRLKLVQGEYAMASAIATQVQTEAEAIYGKKSLKTARALLLKADVSAALGDYKSAAQDMETALHVMTSLLGEDHLQVADIYAKWATALINAQEKPQNVLSLLNKAMAIIQNQLGIENPSYAHLLTYNAYAAIGMEKYSEAFENLTKAEKIWSAKTGKKNHANAAEINVLLGDVYYNLRNYKKAKQHYQKSTRLYEKYFNERHPEYVKVLAKISRVEYMEGNERKAIDLIETVMTQHDQYLQEFFPILSEREKARFWNMIKEDYEYYNSLIINSVKNYEDKRIAKLFDNALNTKGLLLSTSVRLRQNILESKNEKLTQNFNNWISGKELLGRVLTLNPQEILEMGIHKDSLMRAVENLERTLNRQSGLFGSFSERKNISWENVKAALKENEVAVEMVRFRYFDHVFTDSVIYAALLLRNQKRSDKPEVIIFNNGNALEEKYYKGYKNNMVFSMQDNTSYAKFWKPIADQIGKNVTIYFSPDGIYNQINLEALPAPDGRYVVDNFNIILVSNSKDIYLKSFRKKLSSEERTEEKYKRALLCGDPVFYADAAAQKDNQWIKPLPGTRAEVQGISTLFQTKGWHTNTYLETEAKEILVKNMESPKVFHIATHGFYDPAPTKQVAIRVGNNPSFANPLLRSGLLLKGAGDIFAKTNHNYNIENGILTAYEAMNLNLQHTDLVVLSACETGAGDLSAGEGVYGLQRAFLVAGAKVLIMSLFKVNDEITKTLMINFYSRWLETGDIRTSFAAARNIVRAKHPDPIHWGAFVIFGLE